jgi:transcriptional regulator with XRE-family HTH domain
VKAIKLFREEAGLTQRELAELVGCRQHHVNRWEHGDVAVSDTNLARIAKALNRTTWEFRYAEQLLRRRAEVEEAVQGYALA